MTEANNLDLTEELLSIEMSDWQKRFGSGRNGEDLRFGQFIWCKYEMTSLFPEPNGVTDGFGAEHPTIAYVQILEAIQRKTDNNG